MSVYALGPDVIRKVTFNLMISVNLTIGRALKARGEAPGKKVNILKNVTFSERNFH